MPELIYVNVPAIPDVILVEKWFSQPWERYKKRRRTQGGIWEDPQMFNVPGAQPNVDLDKYYQPASEPRRKRQTLSPAQMPSSFIDFTPIIPSQASSGTYILKIRSASPKTDL